MSEVTLDQSIDTMLESEREFEKQQYPDNQVISDEGEGGEARTTEGVQAGTPGADDAGAWGDSARQPNTRSNGANGKDPAQVDANGAQSQQPAGQKPKGWLGSDAKGNLVDDTGKIVARAGSERRLYETSINARGERDRAVQEQTRLYNETLKLQDQVQTLQQRATAHHQFGLNDAELQEGLGFLAQWKQQPMQVVESALTTMLDQGYNIGTLLGKFIQVGEDGQVTVARKADAGGVNPQQIQQLVQQAVSPLMQRQQQEEAATRRQQEIQQYAMQQSERFLSNPAFSQARTHEAILANMIRKDPQLTPEGAYAQLQQFAYQHQLDFTRPLEPQLRALHTQQQPQQPAPTRQSMSPGAVGSAPMQTIERPNTNAATDSYQDIVRSAMKEAGLELNY